MTTMDFRRMVVDRRVEQWRVVDARGETESISSDPHIARVVAECLAGSTIEYRQIITMHSPWRVLEDIDLDPPVHPPLDPSLDPPSYVEGQP